MESSVGNQSFAKIRAWKKDSLEHPSTCVANPSRINRLTPRNWERNRFSRRPRAWCWSVFLSAHYLIGIYGPFFFAIYFRLSLSSRSSIGERDDGKFFFNPRSRWDRETAVTRAPMKGFWGHLHVGSSVSYLVSCYDCLLINHLFDGCSRYSPSMSSH